MSNPYILNSKLTSEEVRRLVWELVLFRPYRAIFESERRTPQSLRPVLNQIERHMYFQSDDWTFFHFFELPQFNLNSQQAPYINEMKFIVSAIFHIPKDESKTRMKLTEEKLDFDEEVRCLFNCPQHLPPLKFVARYGRAQPIQNFKKGEHDDECYARINLKRSCSGCSGKLVDLLTNPKKPFLLRFAMEYAAEHGKPRQQNNDVFIARMIYALVWRAFNLNTRRFLSFGQMVHMNKANEFTVEKRKRFVEANIGKSRKLADLNLHKAKQHATAAVLTSLEKNPIRIDRRGNHDQT